MGTRATSVRATPFFSRTTFLTTSLEVIAAQVDRAGWPALSEPGVRP